MKNYFKFVYCLSVLTLITLVTRSATAHFVWIAKDNETGEVRIYFGENPEPDKKMFLKGISKMKAWSLEDKNFVPTSLTEKTKDNQGWFVAKKSAGREVIGDVSYGVFSKGDASILLHYSAKYAQLNLEETQSSQSAKRLRLDLQAAVTKDKIKLSLTYQKKGVAKCELTIIDPAGETTNAISDETGRLAIPTQKGRYLIRAKMILPESGTANGKDFNEKRNYCTLVLDVVSNKPVTKDGAKERNEFKPGEQPLPNIPKGLTSFGGAISDDKIYIYGGHTGKPHSYYESGQNRTMYVLDLSNPKRWNAAGQGTGLQGLAMVSYNGNVFRLGGFHAHNKEDQEHDLRSVAEFAVFDVEKKSWKQLKPMPAGRSSFDAVVRDNTLYVVGGWTMNGVHGKTWCESAIAFDLSKNDSDWVTLPKPPFKRRALSVGFQADRIVAIGGMQEKGGPTTQVAFFDVKKKIWSDGPELPRDGRMEGFGSSCFNVGGNLVVSTYAGNVYRLSDDFSKWKKITKLEEGRFFHRLLPLDQQRFVLIGGANMESGKFSKLEVLAKD